MRPNYFFTVLKNSNFVRLWGSQILSIFCANMLNFALSYKIFTETNKSIYVSLLYVFYYLPVYILGLFSGVVIDHVSRRKVLFITNLLQSMCVLLYLFAGENILFLYSIIFLYSMVDQFYLPAESAYLPELVKKDELPAANAFFSFASFGGLFFGFVLGGPIMRIFGVQSPFYIASLFLIIGAFSAYLLPHDISPKSSSTLIDNIFAKTKENIIENLRFIFARPKVYLSMFIILFYLMIVSMLAVIMPAFGEQILGVNILDLSWILIFPIAVGAICGALIVERAIVNNGKRGLITAGGLLSGIILLLIYIFSVWSEQNIFISDNLVSIVLLLSVILGFSVSLILIPSQTILQEQTPNEMRGRLYSAQKLLQGIFLILPAVFSATLADKLGVRVLFLAGGIVVISGMLISIVYFRKSGNILFKS